jgi:protein SCO1/2
MRTFRMAAVALLVTSGPVLSGCFDSQAGQAPTAASPDATDVIDFGPLPAFELTSQEGEPVSLETLRGRPFVVAAIFTTCYGPCPRITANMRALQDELSETDIRLVSISVDPETDTPEVLRAYADSCGADPERWLFLTGDEAQIYPLLRDGLWLGVDRAAPDEAVIGMQVTHATKLVAVDRQGRRRGWYEGDNPGELDRLRKRMEFLASED